MWSVFPNMDCQGGIRASIYSHNDPARSSLIQSSSLKSLSSTISLSYENELCGPSSTTSLNSANLSVSIKESKMSSVDNVQFFRKTLEFEKRNVLAVKKKEWKNLMQCQHSMYSSQFSFFLLYNLWYSSKRLKF